ncbi:MAG TPA: SHD1 domain-containing protein [Pirellulales bacterium]|nr:SHD1 domain-containing protein [Pirellulales bacterium]
MRRRLAPRESQPQLFVALSGKGLLLRYDLATAARELTVPFDAEGVSALAIGSAAQGPLYALSGGSNRRGGEVYAIDTQKLAKTGVSASIGWGQGVGKIRAAANNSVVVGDGMSFVPVGGKLLSYQTDPNSTGALFPSADGTLIFGATGTWTPEMKPKDQADRNAQAICIPSVEGHYYLRAHMDQHLPSEPMQLSFSLCVQGETRPLFKLPNIVLPLVQDDFGNSPLYALDKNVFLIPAAKVLAILGPPGGELTLHPFDFDAELEKSGIDYLFVSSAPPTVARLGKLYEYSLTVRSRKGGLKFKLDSGPPGMTLFADGKLRWPVPVKQQEVDIPVVLSIMDSAGQKIFQTFTITVAELAEQAAAAQAAAARVAEAQADQATQPSANLSTTKTATAGQALATAQAAAQTNPFQPAGPVIHGLGPKTSRVWKDSSGKFSVEARFVEVYQDKVTLRKTNGQLIEVPIERLNAADRALARDFARRSE